MISHNSAPLHSPASEWLGPPPPPRTARAGSNSSAPTHANCWHSPGATVPRGRSCPFRTTSSRSVSWSRAAERLPRVPEAAQRLGLMTSHESSGLTQLAEMRGGGAPRSTIPAQSRQMALETFIQKKKKTTRNSRPTGLHRCVI